MNTFQLYKDIQARTKGEIYIGVVGPVRTGKSTLIKRFMDVLVLPHMEDEHEKAQTRDELPQSASGRTIMTTEPKFVPKEAAEISLSEETNVRIRLIDCVGYMVEGASGHIEGGQERQVKTPWFDYEIPFTKAAEIGTRKVIREHATIGLVVTTDGSIGEIPGENYQEAQERTIRELQEIGKPFVVLVNSRRPLGEEAGRLARELEETYGVRALPVNCEQLKEEDICRILEAVLYEFPVSEVQFFIPRWVEMLPEDHRIRQDLVEHARKILDRLEEIRDAAAGIPAPESPYIEDLRVEHIGMDTGCVRLRIDVGEQFYYETLSELTGLPIGGQYELIQAMKNLSALKAEYEEVKDAFAAVVGNEQQAQDLVDYIKEKKESEGGIWETNIFGKSVEELVMDGMRNKISMIGDASQEKLQDTMQKIVNDSNGGLVCIII